MSDSILQVNQIKDKGGNATGITVADTTANVTINNLAGGAIGSAVTMSANQACVKTALNASGDAPIYAVRAWVSFNGNQSGTITNHTGGNVDSITVHSTGVYTINFTTALPDANYAVAGIANGNASNAGDIEVSIDAGTAPTTSACKIFTSSGHKPGAVAGTKLNPTIITVIFVR